MKKIKGDAVPLKEHQVKKFEPPPGKAEASLYDANTNLVLRANRSTRVLPDGTKKITRHWLHRHTVDGKKKLAPLGVYPEMSVTAAREASKNWTPPEKTSPTSALTVSTPAAGFGSLTFGDVIDIYISKERKAQTIKTWLDISETYLTSGELRARPAASITPRDAWQIIETALNKKMVREKMPRGIRGKIIGEVLKSKPTPAGAAKLYSFLHAAFQSAISLDEYNNPFGRLKHYDEFEQHIENREVAEPRALTLSEIPVVWRNLNAPHGHGTPTAARALMLMLVTGQRPSEVASMERREILPPNERGEVWWRIPPEKIKTCKKTNLKTWSPHFVFLTPLALRIIGDYPDYIFPSADADGRPQPLDAHSLITLINKPRSGAGAKAMWIGANDPWSPNDLRKTAQTTLEMVLKCPPDVVAALANHDIRTKIRKRYTVITDDTYRVAKIRWARKWSAWLEKHIGAEHMATIRHYDPPKYNLTLLQELVELGKPNREIAQELGGISETRVRQLRIEHGIKSKAQIEADTPK